MKAGSASIASHYHNKQQYDTLHERISEDNLHAGRTAVTAVSSLRRTRKSEIGRAHV